MHGFNLSKVEFTEREGFVKSGDIDNSNVSLANSVKTLSQ